MNSTYFLACDLGIDHGRVVLGTLAKGKLSLTEITSFPIQMPLVKGVRCWDLTVLREDIFAAIEKAAKLGLPISGISTNSCAGDYVLLDGADKPLQFPARGAHDADSTARLLKKLPLSTIYAETGIAMMPLNTLFQIEAEHVADPALFRRAQRFLPIADYLNAELSGVAACEESLASTTQLYNPQTHAWSPKVVAALDLPGSILPRLVPSGTTIGPVVDALRKQVALLNARVVATCSHATAAAIAAIPARADQKWAYLHSDVNSQLGLELSAPIISDQACGDGFTNEVGLGGTIHFLRNGAGLGLVQECIQAWSLAGQDFSQEQLMKSADQAGPAQAHIAPNDPRLQEPGEMPEKIASLCRATGQPVPATPGETVRVILESLALSHAETLRRLEALTSRKLEVLHVVGRGVSNTLLNQLTADATGLTVIAGPPDAAAIGNILVQALALWYLESPDAIRSIVANSFPTQTFKPAASFEKTTREKFRALASAVRVAQPLAA